MLLMFPFPLSVELAHCRSCNHWTVGHWMVLWVDKVFQTALAYVHWKNRWSWVSSSLLHNWQVVLWVMPIRANLSRVGSLFWEASQRVKDWRGRCPVYHSRTCMGLLAFLLRSFSQAEATVKNPLAWCFQTTLSSAVLAGGGGDSVPDIVQPAITLREHPLPVVDDLRDRSMPTISCSHKNTGG